MDDKIPVYALDLSRESQNKSTRAMLNGQYWVFNFQSSVVSLREILFHFQNDMTAKEPNMWHHVIMFCFWNRLFTGKYELMLFFLCVFYFQLNYQGRLISYRAKGRLHKFELIYDGTAWDVESGISKKGEHHKSKQGAIEHAVKKLIGALKAEGLVS